MGFKQHAHCENCFYSHKLEEADTYLVCRRRPPQPLFETVPLLQWCGEWKHGGRMNEPHNETRTIENSLINPPDWA